MLPPRPEPAAAALGTMNFGRRTDAATSATILHAALDAGVLHVDTANVYNDGESERIVGRVLRERRGRLDGVVVGTKVGLARHQGRPEGLAPARVLAACEESLGRLGVDRIDLYTLHAPDPATPPAETLGAIAELLAAGKIRAWGVSNFASWQILELVGLADAAGLPRPAVAQQLYNVLVRQLDIEYFAYARRFPIETTVYNPLAGGLLTGAHRPDTPPPKGSRFDRNALYRGRYWQAPLFAAVEAVGAIAAAHGLTPLTLAYAFVFRHPGVDRVLLGPASEAHLAAGLAARAAEVPPEALAALDAVALRLAGTDARYAR